MAERKERKSLLMRRRDEKIDLRLNIQKTIHKKKYSTFKASNPTTSRHIDEGKWEQWHKFFLGPKITMDLDCNHKIKTHLLLGRKKGYETGKCIKKQRVTFLQRSVVAKV